MATPRIKPGPQRPVPPALDKDELRLCQRLARLRVLTSYQAHHLVEGFTPHSDRNTRKRLAKLAEQKVIRAYRIHPERGTVSAVYYRLAYRGLVAAGVPESRHLMMPPTQHVLRYLLLRNEVYARARAAGWQVISPTLSAEALHPQLLQQVHTWVRERLEARRRAGDAAAAEQLQRLTTLLPARLAFDCLLRTGGDSVPSSLVLVVVDNPSRALKQPARRKPVIRPTEDPCPKCRAPMVRISTSERALLRCSAKGLCSTEVELPPPASPQIANVPRFLPVPEASLLLRDTGSVYELGTQKLRPSPRLSAWRRFLAERFGTPFVDSDTLLPDVWALRLTSPARRSGGGP